MAAKKPVGSLKPIGAARPKITDSAEPAPTRRGSVQTVRMDVDTLKALKYASIDRGVSQNDIMLTAIRRDLGLE